MIPFLVEHPFDMILIWYFQGSYLQSHQQISLEVQAGTLKKNKNLSRIQGWKLKKKQKNALPQQKNNMVHLKMDSP